MNFTCTVTSDLIDQQYCKIFYSTFEYDKYLIKQIHI